MAKKTQNSTDFVKEQISLLVEHGYEPLHMLIGKVDAQLKKDLLSKTSKGVMDVLEGKQPQNFIITAKGSQDLEPYTYQLDYRYNQAKEFPQIAAITLKIKDQEVVQEMDGRKSIPRFSELMERTDNVKLLRRGHERVINEDSGNKKNI